MRSGFYVIDNKKKVHVCHFLADTSIVVETCDKTARVDLTVALDCPVCLTIICGSSTELYMDLEILTIML